MDGMHSLLKRQLKRQFGEGFLVPAEWQPFIDRVNDAYREFDADRKLLEHSLELSSQELLDANKQSVRLLGSAVEQSSESIVISGPQLDGEGARYQFVNPAFTRMTGYTAAEAIGQTIRILMGPKSDVAATRNMRETLRRGETYMGETIAYRKDRTEFLMERQVVPIRNAAGAITNFLGIQRDITQRKQAEIALRESNEKFHQLADNIADVFWVRSPDMRELYYLSPAFEKIWGRSIESLRAEPGQWSGAIVPEDRERVRAGLETLRGTTPSASVEYRIMRPDGEIRWVHVRGFQVRDAQDRLVRLAGIATDITERKLAEAELAATHRQLVETSRRAGMAEIATNVLHNVGNILNSVNVSAALVTATLRSSRAQGLSRAVQMLDEHSADLPGFLTQHEKGRQLPGYLAQLAPALEREQQKMREELAHLTQSIEHIKDVVATQQSYAGGAGVVEPVQVCDLAEDALRMNCSALTRRGLVVVRQFAPVPMARLDRARVLQILVNLISNASDAMEAGMSESHTITLSVDAKDESTLRISVRDEGEGIPAENLTRIFAHGFTTRKTGHGFGLHSSALAARQMGGTLTAHSDGPGRGATFTLELPGDPVQDIA
ncbi:MAG TPA: PAS domain S-box protein [Ramlibacter sp.]|nr:PAS domain S-box protein [Ramlibacter sp.]